MLNELIYRCMGNLKYFSLLMAAGMFAACSDNLENAGNGGENTPSATEGFVRVSINTPTTNGNISRANDDQDVSGGPDIEFNDGIANEYKIDNGVIVFFKTSSAKDKSDPDANATFVSAYQLTGLTSQQDPSEQVTSKVVTVSEAPMVDTSKDEALYALVILNTPSTVVVDANTHGLTLGGTALTAETSKLEAFTAAFEDQKISDYIGELKDKFTMCNAPLSTAPGAETMTSAAAKTLVPVTVYKTKNEAESKDAARIYVERVAAKVTLKGFTYSKTTDSGTQQVTETYTMDVKNDAGVFTGDVVLLDGWTLNVTNKSTKLVRDVSGYNANTGGWLAAATPPATNKIARFAGVEVIPVDYNDTPTNYFRIYWAEDGNYTSDKTSDADFLTYYTGDNGNITPSEPSWNPDTSDNNSESNKDYALYCFENTMNYDQQHKDRTTGVLLKTTYKTKFGTQTEATAQDFFICGASPVKYPVKNNIPDVGGNGNVVEDIITHVITEANKVLAAGSQIGENHLAVNVDASAGIYDTKDELKKLFTLDSETEDKWNAIWNQIGTVRYYKEAISYYYATLIRHFYDDETPWSDGESYGIQHLGRYGVVRNNWYEIEVSSISGPGEPGIVKPEPGDPDDKTEGYIRAEINVLSWAKRSQGVDL